MAFVRTYGIRIKNPVDASWDVLGECLRDMEYVAWRFKNLVMTDKYIFEQESYRHKQEHGEYLKPKDVFGHSLETELRHRHKPKFDEYHVVATTYPSCVQEVIQAYGKVKSDLMYGKATLPSFKKGGAFPMAKQNIKFLSNGNVKLTVMSKEKAKKYNRTQPYAQRIEVALFLKGQTKLIVDRILSGEYQLADSQIMQKKNKWYLMIAYKTETVNQHAISKDVVMGVDLGVVNAVAMAISNSKVVDKIPGGEILQYRRGVESRRRSMMNQLPTASDNRRGHGRKTLLKPIEKLQRKSRDFAKTTNHRYARYIINTAIKNGAGVIQMETLKGINERSTFLKSWSYYQLQKFIEEKAEVEGIEVRYIDPSFTSQRCNKCGIIDKDNRPTQELFHCTHCDHKANADYNAARNIAMVDIENIIQEQLEVQSRHVDWDKQRVETKDDTTDDAHVEPKQLKKKKIKQNQVRDSEQVTLDLFGT